MLIGGRLGGPADKDESRLRRGQEIALEERLEDLFPGDDRRMLDGAERGVTVISAAIHPRGVISVPGVVSSACIVLRVTYRAVFMVAVPFELLKRSST